MWHDLDVYGTILTDWWRECKSRGRQLDKKVKGRERDGRGGDGDGEGRDTQCVHFFTSSGTWVYKFHFLFQLNAIW